MNAPSITTSDLCGQFLHHLAAQPDAPAVISRDGVISFRSMGRMIAAAQQIVTAAKPRTVGLYFTPTPALVAAAWGALFSGVAYVPLAPTYPEDRIHYMIGAGDVDLVLTPAELRGDLEEIVAGTDVSIAEIPAVADIPAPGGGDTPRDTAAPDAIAFVLYTSGSTGAPKGVEIPQASLAHQMRWINAGLGLGPGARIVHKTPISFDAAQWEFLANATGAAVVVGDPDLYRDPEALIGTVTTHQVTHLQVVPTLLQALCEEPTFSDCTSLRLVASGGESLSSRLGSTAVGMLPAARIVNVYGPTETTINSSFYPLPRPLDGPASVAGVVPIGLPIDGLAFHLLDEAGEPTDSAIGEIGISGLQLARGYRNRPEETDRRFVTRVINGTPTRLYRTGDVGELIDGIFHFRGRTDSQVKIRGHRIELDEIRNVLENHERVRHAGVFTVDRGNGDAPRLVAHVELNPHADEGVLHAQGLAEIISTDIARMLPHYMLPDVIRILDDLPRTPSGKIDIRALHEAELVRADHPDEDAYIAPATLVEQQLAQLWQESLQHDSPVSTATSFFALGGSSIAAVRLVKNIRARFGVPLPVQAIFEHDTIAKQARALSAGNTAAFSRAVPLAGKGDHLLFLWSGLGGYPMNLRALAESIAGTSYRCYGLQAHGLNDGEDIEDDTIVVMARRDIEQVRRIQPHGPYNLIGYSFGARIAFEVAHQLETQGETVDRVILLAPGSPSIQQEPATPGADGRYRETWFKRLLFSVFFGRTDGPLADNVAATVTGRDSFLKTVASDLEIDTSLADRITRLVEKTCEFEYTFTELADRNLAAAITIIRAAGDDYSFLDTVATDVSYTSGTLDANHYQILRTPHVEHTASAVIAALTEPTITKIPKENSRTSHATLGRV
ncbi:amino acid adenylation domain-containing protein [Streptomyces buecherae]|uniref:amino acid adenylation domain-containing protein n=1 Tax=Streptomyces buecherae TaxID=2763006 RepID=UPI0036775E21